MATLGFGSLMGWVAAYVVVLRRQGGGRPFRWKSKRAPGWGEGRGWGRSECCFRKVGSSPSAGPGPCRTNGSIHLAT